ncbi:alpha-hydroxy acid oxidase [Pollutimonas harenae]|uniref:Alpha-hydroxy-acid oxidizing protein n=1 Tax=Pollutimonas harenae TaxID=657015 RepID=A0A853GTA1_9BURK|nr:alpha-hydroxy acid oxidase [Pollutimonas harenae]NYT84006.1 alpha-hydroxy-acid oxidizing protein [Pollutimonas harenae]TEA73567.1 alpha-hydroxy-acid oxidizing protein [Pollutimonas harenae]
MSTKPPRALRRIFSLNDFERPARKKLPRPIFSYIYNGADEEVSLAHNRTAFNDYLLLPRMLEDVSARSQTIELFGQTYSSPFGISPVGLGALYAYRGDIVLANAAARANIPAILSGASLIPMEEVARQAPNTWFQAYMPGDVERVDALLARVKAAGFNTLVVTVDLPVSVNPENYIRNGFSSPLRPSVQLAWQGLSHPRWLLGTFGRTLLQHGMPHLENWRAERGAPILSATIEKDLQARDHFNWGHMRQIRDRWQGTLIVKGLVRWQDAVRARDAGVDGIIVSNHGGRQMDGSVSPLHVLPEIVKAVPDVVVMMDSGIRRGSDVIKALSLGARCVFAGRPFNYASSVAGGAGVDHAINILQTELHRAMALLGLNRLEELDGTMVRHVDSLRPARSPSSTLRQ